MSGKARNTYLLVLSAMLTVFFLTLLITLFSSRKAEGGESVQYTIHQQRPPEPLPEITPAIEEGKKLFNQLCISCHILNKRGFTILGFENRGPWSDRQKLWEWLVDPKAFMKKDKYTAAMYKELGTLQTAFPDITRQQSDAIADYLIYVNKSKGKN